MMKVFKQNITVGKFTLTYDKEKRGWVALDGRVIRDGMKALDYAYKGSKEFESEAKKKVKSQLRLIK